MLHYRSNAASPVPTAVGSFTTSLPCAFPPIYPGPPIPANESRGTVGCVDHIVPAPSVGYRLCRPQSPATEKCVGILKWVLVGAEMSASHTLLLYPKSHSEFKGSLLERWGTYLLLEKVDFLLMLTWCLKRMCARQKGIFFFTSLQPKILLKIYKASIELTR